MLAAYHNDPAVKDLFLNRVAEHRAADTLVQGTGWENGKGCAVGCTLEAYDHAAYEKELGIPEALARIEDVIFEGLPVKEAKLWPERFLCAVPVGVDLSRVQWQFLHWLLADSGLLNDGGRDDVRQAINGTVAVLSPLLVGAPVDVSAAESAAAAAGAARSAAGSAAGSAARSAAGAARSAAGAAGAESAESAEWSAAGAAWSAESAAGAAGAESAEWSAAGAESAAESAEWSAAESAAWSAMAYKLEELLGSA